MAHKSRRAEGSNLAFLDIMSCGLGAVILVFMLVKQNIADSPAEIDNLKQDISTLEQARDEAQQNLAELRAQLKKENVDLAAMSRDFKQQRDDLEGKKAALQPVSYTHLTLPTNREV